MAWDDKHLKKNFAFDYIFYIQQIRRKYMRVYGNKSGKVDIYNIDNTLEALQEFIGGYIEPLKLGNNLIMLFDEDGRMKQLPVTCVLLTLAMPIEIRGNYLVLRQYGSKFTDLTDDDIKELKKKGF